MLVRSAPSMVQMRVVFERHFGDVLRQLQDGMSGQFRSGLVFEPDEAFYGAVAAAAAKAQVCHEGSLRALLHHKEDLRTEITNLMEAYQGEFSEEDRRVAMSGTDTGTIILTHTSTGSTIGRIEPSAWLGREHEAVDLVFPSKESVSGTHLEPFLVSVVIILLITP